jgi:predicted AlkP superfamily phosphohydrolase/phosphomutase
MNKGNSDKYILAAFFGAAVLFYAFEAGAYIGPGAGFAIVGSFMAFFLAFVAAIISIILWPIRAVYMFIRRRMLGLNPMKRRVIVLGLDGLDPKIAQELMDQGKLPNFKKLAEDGYFKPLRTTSPSMSPVAWSTFMTGVNPGKHSIFDFLVPDRKTYLPVLSSSYIGGVSRTVKLGKYIIPLGSPEIRLLRRSVPFWKILGDNYIFSQVLRVPITFPPEKFYGTCLSAMCVPDLKGTQGSFTFFTTAEAEDIKHTGGVQVKLEPDGTAGYKGEIPGPENPLVEGAGEMRIPFQLKNGSGNWKLVLPDEEIELSEGEYTDWVELIFKPGLGVKASGIGRFRLLRTEPSVDLYLTPINIDPRAPVMPISHPGFFGGYLAKLQGPYSTLGLAEDTWGLNERVLDEAAFLEQVWDIHDEREKMFFRALDTTRKGCVVCVFDVTDRIQHMFMRYRDPGHPANRDKDTEKHAKAIDELYENMDDLLGRTLAKVREGDALFVMSDHGFTLFKRGMNLNSWLWKNGYLETKDGKPSGELFENVDWERTRAYALGLSGIFLNIKGREGKGTVDPEEAPALRKEMAEKLCKAFDDDAGVKAVEGAYPMEEAFQGPYAKEGPDLVVGFKPGWRVSWGGAMGEVTENIFEDNVKGWSGDHCVDSKFVPGVLFSNMKLDDDDPWIGDLAPTVLTLFGVTALGHMDGKSLVAAEAARTNEEGSGERVASSEGEEESGVENAS